MPQFSPIRILDATANRAAEGLRVVEDYVRFVLEDAHLTRLLKQARHDCAEHCQTLLGVDRLPMRDTQCDVGTDVTTASEVTRADVWNVCVASLERTKQSLRSLEEFSKVSAPESAGNFEALRYRLYTIEKAIGITHDSQSRLQEVRLCVLIEGRDSVEAFEQLVTSLIDADVGMLQLRDKKLSDRELSERAKLLVDAAKRKETGRPLVIVNDRADIAAAVNADGVHLGQDDLSVKDARAIVGARKLIGVSTHSIQQARSAVLDGANYLGAGPTFPSTTKSFEDFPGLEYLEQITSEVTLPTFAIGGIASDNLEQVLETGVHRVAVSGAISSVEDPGVAVRKFLDVLGGVAAR